jgi:hypothetical protein
MLPPRRDFASCQPVQFRVQNLEWPSPGLLVTGFRRTHQNTDHVLGHPFILAR